jgi:hypothetical protein
VVSRAEEEEEEGSIRSAGVGGVSGREGRPSFKNRNMSAFCVLWSFFFLASVQVEDGSYVLPVFVKGDAGVL